MTHAGGFCSESAKRVGDDDKLGTRRIHLLVPFGILAYCAFLPTDYPKNVSELRITIGQSQQPTPSEHNYEPDHKAPTSDFGINYQRGLT